MIEINKIHNMDCIEGMKQMDDNSVDAVVTDPPYGINYQSQWVPKEERFDKIYGDGDICLSFIKDSFRVLKNSGALYLFTRWDVYPEYANEIKSEGFTIKNVIIWNRMVHGMGDLKGCYAPCYDMIIFAVKGHGHILKNGRPIDVISVRRVGADKMVHPTEKPIRLIEKLIDNSTEKNDTILDPFMGSGTTALACIYLQRNFIGFEISPEYCKIAEERLKAVPKRLDKFGGVI